MSGAKVKDMTEGNIVKILVAFSAPMLLGNLFQQLYNMVDSVIVGNYVGSYALGAVGVCGTVNFLFFSMCNGIAAGVGILIAQYFGAAKEALVRKTIFNGCVVIMIVGLLMGIMGIVFAGPALIYMQTPPEYIEDSIRYLRIISIGTVAVAAYNMISFMLRALGDSKTPLKFLIVSSILNAVLDLLFVLALKWGVCGAAVATVIAQAVSALLCIVYAMRTNSYFRIAKDFRKLDKWVIKNCLWHGIPLGLQNLLIGVSTVFLQRVANGFGADTATAYTMTSRLEQLIHQPYVSLAAAVSTFTGQNIGANKIDRVKKGLWDSLSLCAVFSFTMLLFMQFFGSSIMRIFGDDPDVLLIAGSAIRITSCFYVMLGTIYIVRALLNGSGDAIYPLLNGVVEVFGRICFALVLMRISIVGIWAVWLTTGLTWTITAIASVIRYRQRMRTVGNVVSDVSNGQELIVREEDV